LLAVRWRSETISSAVRLGFAEMTKAVIPATKGVALDVPPNSESKKGERPEVVSIPSPVTAIRQYACELLDGAQTEMPSP
jgi:hypothetical protein